jgi:hypothetical protein
MSDERKLNTGQKRKTTEPSAKLRIPASPASFLPAKNGSFFARGSLDTLGRTESHSSGSKQAISAALTRHSYEGTPQQLSQADSATKRPPWFYGAQQMRSISLIASGSLPLRVPHPLVCKSGASPWSLPFAVILRSAATRDPLLSQGKEHPRLQDAVRSAF